MANKIRKNELVDKIAASVTTSKKDISKIIDEMENVVVNELKGGNEVNFTKLGTFKVSDRAERNGINPKTGEKITINASKACTFKASKNLKSALN